MRPDPDNPADLPSTGTPLLAGSILGLRHWGTNVLFTTLWSGHTGALWDAEGGATAAVCPRDGCRLHRPPVKDCTCGLYAWHPRRVPKMIARRMAKPDTRKVVGVVEAWGRIEIHTMGFRAEFARPVAFVNPDWPEPTEGSMRQERVAYEYRLFELSERCGAELINPSEGDSVIDWLKNDERYLAPAAIRRLLPFPHGYRPRRPME